MVTTALIIAGAAYGLIFLFGIGCDLHRVWLDRRDRRIEEGLYRRMAELGLLESLWRLPARDPEVRS